MSDPQCDPTEPTLGHLLAQVARLVGGRMRVRMEAIGLQRAQAHILFQLWQEDGLAQNELAQALHVSPATATSALQRMEREGWIERRRDEADQRVVRVYLTGKARAPQREVRAALLELDEELSSALSGDERRVLRESLLKVRRHLSETGGGGPDGAWSAAEAGRSVRGEAP
ncbi:MAG: MarR family transcriptional regulator [Deltaproteobacteria bacterium]|nr:MarR family transcriptional regulator [Deltaproteobacteria bacterium]